MMNTVGTKFILAERYIFDPNNNSLLDQQNEEEFVRLGSNESRILLMFVQHPNEVIKRLELHDFVWRKQGFEVDDSSLTQAISTLRKILNDSTKSPQFIKTVPKRGYQFIAHVEKTTVSKPTEAHVTSDETAQTETQVTPDTLLSESSDSATDITVETDSEHDVFKDNTVKDAMASSASTASSTPIYHQHAAPQTWSTGTLICLIIALILPFLSVSIGMPMTQTLFTELTSYHGIPVQAPQNNPSLDRWLPSIELCIKKYALLHQGEEPPTRILATGGQEDQLSLSFIFSENSVANNTTFNILASNEELSKICR